MTDLSKTERYAWIPSDRPDATIQAGFTTIRRLGKVTLRDCADSLAGFLYYILCSRPYRREVLASATGTTVKRHGLFTHPRLNRQFLPTLGEQQRIGASFARSTTRSS